MKIYEIGTGYTPIPARMGAATEIVVEELTKAFRKKSVPVEIIDIASDSRVPNYLPIREVKVPKCFTATDVKLGLMHKLKRVVYSISLTGMLKKILIQSNEKVVLHFHNQYNLYFFLKLTPRRIREKAIIAYTTHSYVWHDPWEQIEDMVRKRYFQEIYCIKRADYIFVLNEQTRDNFINNLEVVPEKIHLIDNGVNVETYSILDNEQKQAHKRERGLDGKKVFIQVGSVCERKNQLTAVKLLLPLMQQDENIVFCYAGGIIDSAYKMAVEKYAEDNGVAEQVQYAGELQPGEQLNAFYNLAEAMVFPSKAEGFSLVIIEAMSAGVPVLISNQLQFKIAENCFQYDDYDMFADIVKDQIMNREVQHVLSREARHFVLDAYSWDKVAEDYLAIWNKDTV